MRGTATGAGSSPLAHGGAHVAPRPPAADRPRSLALPARRPPFFVGSLVSLLPSPQPPARLRACDSRTGVLGAERPDCDSSPEVSERVPSWRCGAPGPPALPALFRPPARPQPRRGRAPPAALSRLPLGPGPCPCLCLLARALLPKAAAPPAQSPEARPAASRAPSPARPGLVEPKPPARGPRLFLSHGCAGQGGGFEPGPATAPCSRPRRSARGCGELKWERNSLQLHLGFYIEYET